MTIMMIIKNKVITKNKQNKGRKKMRSIIKCKKMNKMYNRNDVMGCIPVVKRGQRETRSLETEREGVQPRPGRGLV